MSEVAKRYAHALFDVAQERDKINDIGDDLRALQAVFAEDNIRSLFMNPRIGSEEKQAAVDAFRDQVQAETSNLLRMLTERDRENELDEITQYYIDAANESQGIAEATVTTAQPISEGQEQQLAEAFGQALDKTLRMDTKVREDVIGGMLVRVGNRVYDGTLAGKLERFKQRTMQTRVGSKG